MSINKNNVQGIITQMEEKVGITESREIFVSYHLQTSDFKFNGFGNMVAKFYPQMYKNNVAKFITDLEKSITMALETLHKKKFEVKILFFK
jgi:hypothetical protein